jgi:hypothetical protein
MRVIYRRGALFLVCVISGRDVHRILSCRVLPVLRYENSHGLPETTNASESNRVS